MTESQYAVPKQLLAVDCIIFGYEKETLKLLLAQRKMEPARGEWSLLGGWVLENETVEEAAERVLYQITGLKHIFLEQVKVFSDLNRDPGGRVISVTFYAMIRIDKHDRELVKKHGAKWWIFNKHPNLIFDHNQMVVAAHEKLKWKASHELIGQDLLPSKFTLLQLRKMYETVFQREFDPGNFRKKILSLKVLDKLDDKNTVDSKKGAYYYRFRKDTELSVLERIVKLHP